MTELRFLKPAEIWRQSSREFQPWNVQPWWQEKDHRPGPANLRLLSASVQSEEPVEHISQPHQCIDVATNLQRAESLLTCYYSTHSGVNASSKSGDRVPKLVRYGEGVFFSPPGTPLPTWGGVWEGTIFCYLKMAYFDEFWGAKFKVFLYCKLPQWGLGQLCGKFWIFEQNNEEKTSVNAVVGQGRLVLVSYLKVRNNIGVGEYSHRRPPQPKYWRGCVPGIPGGVDASEHTLICSTDWSNR